MAPELKGKLFGSENNDYKVNYKVKITVLDFWFMNCVRCQKSIPFIDSLKNKYEKDGVQFFAVNRIDNTPKSLPKLPEFIKEYHLGSQILLVNNDPLANFGLLTFPTFFVIGPDGKVAYCFTGYHPSELKQMSVVIDKLLKK